MPALTFEGARAVDHPATDPDAPYRRPAAPTLSTFPQISDYWPDAPHRIGPPADHYLEEPTAAPAGAPLRRVPREPQDAGAPPTAPPPRRRRVRYAVPALAGAVLLIAATGAVLAGLSRDHDTGADVPPATTRLAPARPATVSALTRGRTAARFELASNAATITLRTAALGDDLYRVTTPDDSGVLPRAVIGDDGVRLFLDDNGARGDATVQVLLSDAVRWSLRITGGVRRGAFDLGTAKVDRVDLDGGAARIDLTLPEPDGTLPIRMSGGVDRFEVHPAPGVPTRVRTRQGAGLVRLGGRTDDGVARGASFRSPDWARSRNRVDLDAVAGVGTLVVGSR
jgi:hypothetical protein